jgi:uncharacterized protein
MKLTLNHVPHLSTKISIDLNKSGLITMTSGLEKVAQEAEKVIIENVKKEEALEARVHDIVDDNEEQIDFYLADERQLFYMIKKKLAEEYGVILNYEERFSDLAHKILDNLYEEDLIHYDVSENRIKNVIYDSMTSYIADTGEVESAVIDTLNSYKRKLIPGTDEYEILFEKLYKEELTKRGMA